MKTQQKGIALISVLWVMAIIVIIAMIYSQGIKLSVQQAANVKNYAATLNLAEEGIWRGAMLALSKGIKSKEVQLDGTKVSISSGEGKLTVSLQAVDGLIDLNRSPPEVLQQLFYRATNDTSVANSLTDALLDWRDEDNTRRPNGAEKNEYNGLGYSIKNGLMNSVDELRRVRGVTQLIYDKVEPYTTVYSSQPRISIEYAPKEVIYSLPGIDEERGELIFNTRKSGENIEYLSFVPVETKRYIGSGDGSFIKVSSLADVNGVKAGIIAVIQLTPQADRPITVVSWREKVASIFDQG